MLPGIGQVVELAALRVFARSANQVERHLDGRAHARGIEVLRGERAIAPDAEATGPTRGGRRRRGHDEECHEQERSGERTPASCRGEGHVPTVLNSGLQRRVSNRDTASVPRKPSPRVAAAIDIGSNSVHLLVARAHRQVRPGTRTDLETLVDESDLIGLGDAVDGGGTITPEGLQTVVDSLHRLLPLAEGAGASHVVIVGTEPLRRATNADELIAAIERFTGHKIHVIAERHEAQLTFLGVTTGKTPDESLAVVDIGGGSTEASIHVPGAELDVVPLKLGSARLTNAIVHNDPPTVEEINELVAAAREAVDSARWPEDAGLEIRRAVFVGGTATNVARLGVLDRKHLNEDLSTLAQMSAEKVVEHFDVRPRRAQQMAAGVAIVSVLLDRFLLGEADVSDASLRDGAIIAVLAKGDEWPEALGDLVAGR